jgi:cation:H+ antiporter
MAAAALIAAGLVALVVGGELLLRGGSQVARRIGIPPIVIGQTVVSIGTSTPELAISIEAAVNNVGELAVGNIAGTNTVNLLLILGLSALLRPLALNARTLRVDLPMTGLAALALLALAADGALTRIDGVALLAVAVLYTVAVTRAGRRERAAIHEAYEREGRPDPSRHPVLLATLEVTALLVGIVVVVVGADWLVDGAVDLARQLGVSNAVIGLTIVAIGTSAPELVTTIISTVRDHRDIAIGNLIGSGVYNVALILGLPTLIAPGGLHVPAPLVWVDLPVMTAAVLACMPVFLSGRRASRLEGGLFVLAYAVYLGYLIVVRT